VLGSHVSQAGSLVEEDRLRFDFNHHSALTKDQLDRVENWVRQAISASVPLVSKEMKKEEALSLGAMAMFGEKYGEVVRTVQVSSAFAFLLLIPDSNVSLLLLLSS
jgi:alanyl-tRNA synthetase